MTRLDASDTQGLRELTSGLRYLWHRIRGHNVIGYGNEDGELGWFCAYDRDTWMTHPGEEAEA